MDQHERWVLSRAEFSGFSYRSCTIIITGYGSEYEELTPAFPSSRLTTSSSDSPRVTAPEESSDLKIPLSDKAIKAELRLRGIQHFLTTLERPPHLADAEYRQFICQASDYFVSGKQFFRKSREGRVQLIPDKADRLQLIKYAHDELGHKGAFATTHNLLVRFWWPLIQEDVRWYVKTCHQCQLRQTEYFHIPPSVPHVPTLFRKAHIDTFLMPKNGSYRYVHHACDALTSYAEGRGATSDSSIVIADFIFQDILCRWGGLGELVTDNGPAYIGALDILAKRYRIRHIRISGYNSCANGIVESKQFDVREAIMKTCDGDESKWPSVLPQVFWAERVTIRKSTGYSPYYMAHGVHPLLPFDIVEATYLAPTQDFGISTEELVAIRARQLAKRPSDLEKMQSTVTQSRIKNLERFEKQHASRIVDFDFQPAALVLVRNTRIEESLNRKSKPRYLSPMVVVRKTVGTSYIVAELDGAQSQLRIAGFRLIPYFPRTHTDVPVISNLPESDDTTKVDPKDLQYLASSNEDKSYEVLPSPSF